MCEGGDFLKLAQRTLEALPTNPVTWGVCFVCRSPTPNHPKLRSPTPALPEGEGDDVMGKFRVLGLGWRVQDLKLEVSGFSFFMGICILFRFKEVRLLVGDALVALETRW